MPLSLACSDAKSDREGIDVLMEKQVAAAIADTEISPISDVRGSASYKRLLLRQLIFAHLNRLCGLEEGLP